MTPDAQLKDGWTHVQLSEIVDLNPRRWSSEPAEQDTVSFVPMAAVEAGSGVMDSSKARPWGEVRRGFTTFQDGDVLFAKITPCMENGKAAVARKLIGSRGAGSTEFHVLRPTAAIDPTYLLQYLLQETFRDGARAGMKGTAGQLRVPADYMANATIPLPPLAEQRRIVAAIEQQFTRLDAAVASLQRARANLTRYRAAVLQTFLWSEDHAEWVSLDEVSSFKPGFAFRSGDWQKSGVPVVRISCVQDGSVDLSHCAYVSDAIAARSQEFKLQTGDILLALTGDVGDVAIVPENGWLLNQRVARLRIVDEHRYDRRWLFYTLRSEQIRRELLGMAKGMAQANVSPKQVRNMKVPQLSLAKQERIVAEVEQRLSVIEVLERALGKSLKRAERLRQAILKRAFAGELVPQDPSDEPASALLERIRAAQAGGQATPKRTRQRPTRKPKQTGQSSLF